MKTEKRLILRKRERPTEEIPQERDPKELAAVIDKISDAMQRLLKSGLNREAITVLLNHQTKVPMRDISSVLNGLENLKRRYLQ